MTARFCMCERLVLRLQGMRCCATIALVIAGILCGPSAATADDQMSHSKKIRVHKTKIVPTTVQTPATLACSDSGNTEEAFGPEPVRTAVETVPFLKTPLCFVLETLGVRTTPRTAIVFAINAANDYANRNDPTHPRWR